MQNENELKTEDCLRTEDNFNTEDNSKAEDNFKTEENFSTIDNLVIQENSIIDDNIKTKDNIKMEANIKNNETDKLIRRKRINRIKTVIIIIAILFLILPTIFCIILSVQVGRLQNQVRELAVLHDEYEAEETDGNNYAYAAEINPDDVDETAASQSNNSLEEHTESNTDPSPVTEPDNKEDTKTQENTASQEDNASKEDAGANEGAEQQENETTDPSKDQNNIQDNKDDGAIESNSVDNGIYAGKKVYLTFDDGPSTYTDEILEILSDYNIKATFFVIGKTDEKSKETYKRIVEEGHTLGMHSYSHKYEKIYNSVEDFDKDFTKLRKLLYDTTGYMPTIYRFPGGSDNQVNKNGMEDFIKYLNDASVVYYDWNVLNGDATGEKFTEKQLINNVLDGVKMKKTSIVLMHDSQTKESTVTSLPKLIEALIAGGAQILPLDEEVPPIQMIKADSVK